MYATAIPHGVKSEMHVVGPSRSLLCLLFLGETCSVKDLEVIRDQRKTTEEKSSRDSGHDQFGSSHKCSHSRHVKDHPTSRFSRTKSEEKTDSTNGGP